MTAAAAAVVSAVCSWPLVRSHPLAGSWAAAVTAGYAYAAHLCWADRRAARWLLAGGLLWAGSVVSAARWAAVPATACWVALWVALAAGPAVLGGDTGGIRHRLLGTGSRLRAVALAAIAGAGTVAAVSLAAAGAAGAGTGTAQWWPGTARTAWVIIVQGVLAAAVPLAVGITVWHRRSARAGVSALLTQLATPPTVEGVQSVLRAVLKDPTAAVFYRLPDARLPDVPDFVSAAGERVQPPARGRGRLVFPAKGHDRKISALLSVADPLSVAVSRVQAAIIACGPALENARLQAILRDQLREVSASRSRIVQTAVAERRRLARDLHDGAQQHLHVLSTTLGIARQNTTQPQSLAAIDAARDQLRIALGKLRGLGRDLCPAVLDTDGLTAALESLADNGPLDVSLVSKAGRLNPETEIVAYLTIRETLQGLAEHTGATQANVTVIAENGQLTMQVTSDGTPGNGAGLGWISVITDRIRADGGDLSIRSEPDPVAAQGGICVEAWIPCG
ncbi:MAG: histidine kinase [Actinomycetota bacterium]